MSLYKEVVRNQLTAIEYRLRNLEYAVKGFTTPDGDVITGVQEEVVLLKKYLLIERCDIPATKKFCKKSIPKGGI